MSANKKKQSRLSSETDKESVVSQVPKKKKFNLIKNYCESFEQEFNEEEKLTIEKEILKTKKLDPLIIFRWESQWQMANGPLQNQLIQNILQNGGSDHLNTGCIFHFNHLEHVMECRRQLKLLFPQIFHPSALAQAVLNVPAQIPIARCWIAEKININSTDIAFQDYFFEM